MMVVTPKLAYRKLRGKYWRWQDRRNFAWASRPSEARREALRRRLPAIQAESVAYVRDLDRRIARMRENA